MINGSIWSNLLSNLTLIIFFFIIYYPIFFCQVINYQRERSHSSVMSNDGETSKYNNQQGIHNYWTCQCNTGGSCHLRGAAATLARGEADIAPWRRLHFRNCLPLPILLSVRNNPSGICLYLKEVAAWTTTWQSMGTTRWIPAPVGVPTFWRYQCGAVILWSWTIFDG